ncbi:MAG: sulfatase [bacterium]|nr:sulfatase [bacterium]
MLLLSLRLLVATLVLIASTTTVGADAADDDSDPTNVVIILADDLGYGSVGGFGIEGSGIGRPGTPALDQMADEGARLTHFYVPMPCCAPSRTALLTGRYPFRNGMTGNPHPGRYDDVGIRSSEILLSEVFQAAGYRTICIGKWHLGHQPRFHPARHGFDEFYGMLYSNDMPPVRLYEGEAVVEYPVVQATLTKRYTSRAVRFIEENQSRRFFLYLAHAMPHKPLACSEEFYGKSGAGLYGDVIAELDWSVGQVLSKLKELNLASRTLVVFLSDNGPYFGGSTGGLRGMKDYTFEGGMRVPMIAWWPEHIPPGHTSRELAGAIDLFPTLLKAAGVAAPAKPVLDGKDIISVLTSNAASPHEAMIGMRSSKLMTVRGGRWRLHVRAPSRPGWHPEYTDAWVDPSHPDGVTILAPFEQPKASQFPGVESGDAPKPMMLFDLENDPAEQHDVAGKHPDVVQRLKALFDEFEAHAARLPN